MSEPAPLQQINRTYVRSGSRVLSFFGGCDFFRLSMHPRILAAVRQGTTRYGLNVAASRRTTGNHQLYLELETKLREFFSVEAALAVSTGYGASVVVAQAVAGEFSHALIDQRAHVALQEAARALDCPVLKFKHRDAAELARALQRCGAQSRPLVLTDGVFGHDGAVAPLTEYLAALPRDGALLVDDAYGAGTLGRGGRGTPDFLGVSRGRIIQCITLSKAFGVYGGAVLGTRQLRAKIFARSRMFIGSTPLPLPLVNASLVALQILGRDESRRRRLQSNLVRVRSALRAARLDLPEHPGPIIAVPPLSPGATRKLAGALLRAGIFPPLLKYPGGPAGGYFRLVISSEHSREQLDGLIQVLTQHFVS